MIFSLMMKIFLNILWRCERILSINILLLLWWQRIFFQFQHLMLMLSEFLILLMMSVIIVRIILIQIQLRWLCWWNNMRNLNYENSERILIYLIKRKKQKLKQMKYELMNNLLQSYKRWLNERLKAVTKVCLILMMSNMM